MLCFAAFMVILDAQIVTVAVPEIGRDLAFGTAGGVQWVMTAYMVAFGGLLLLGGRISDVLGRRRVFMAGVALFALSSLACGLAWTGAALIVARAVQGLSAAVMTPTALSIVLTLYPEGRERTRALGIWGAVAGVGGTAGALVGGVVTDGLGWEWVFYINVPVGAAMLALSPVLLPADRRARASRRTFDAAGAVTGTGALSLLVFTVSEVPERGWTAGWTLGPAAASVVIATLFVATERRSANPLLPPRLFASRWVTGGNLLMLLAGMAAFGQGFILTQYTQRVLGWSAVGYGLGTVALPLLAVIGSIAAQRVVVRLDVRVPAAVSVALIGVGCVLFSRISVVGHFLTDLLPGMLIFGLGLGATTVAASIAAVRGIHDDDAGIASGVNNAAFQVGGAIGIAILSTAAVSRTHSVAAGAGHAVALTDGYRLAFVVAVGFALLGLLVALILRSCRGEVVR